MKNEVYLKKRFQFIALISCISMLAFAVVLLLEMRKSAFLWCVVLFALIQISAMITFYRTVWMPYCHMSHQLERFAISGNKETLGEMNCFVDREMKMAVERVVEYMSLSTTLELSKRQAQYQALQNQINPHFLYNTLESIRSESLISGLNSVADMCEALANFFRYTISNMENLVTVKQEVDNIKTYFYIQQYRFGEKLQLEIVYPPDNYDEIMSCQIPKLTFQPIVENAIIHGIERKVGCGKVKIEMALTKERLIICISDNGVGMNLEILNQIKSQMEGRSNKWRQRGGIALGNVHNRIKMLFGEEYGLTLFSTKEIGTDVEISLPKNVEKAQEVMQSRGDE